MAVSERPFQIVTGIATTVFFVATSYVSVLYANGNFDDTYDLLASFDAAGQGLIKDSDVKVRGINVGSVESVELREGRALVTMEIDGDERIPADVRAVVRPKTLFGEKFVDLEVGPDGEERGPYLGHGDEIADTVGSFELEKVLAGARSLLESADPADVAVIVDTLAEASRGQGERIRAQVQNWAAVTDVFARHDADTRRFLDDLETLVGAFERASGDVVALSRLSNSALPSLNAQAGRFDDLLDDAADVSRHLAEVLEREHDVLETLATEGGKSLAVLHEHREQVPKVIVGLRDFAQILAQASLYEGNSFSVVDGGSGRAATIKLVAEPHTLLALFCSLTDSPACPGGGATAAGASRPVAAPGAAAGGGQVVDGVDAVEDVVGRIVLGIVGGDGAVARALEGGP